MAGIPCAEFVFDDNLATELETCAKANVKLLLRVANVALTSSDTFWPATLVGVVPRLVEVLVLVDLAWMAFQYRNW